LHNAVSFVHFSGWHEFEGRCYRYVDNRLSWDDAEGACYVYGAHLTSVRAMHHLHWLGKIAENKSFWIGKNLYRECFAIFYISQFCVCEQAHCSKHCTVF
jgi:hypothetical protein